MLRALAVGIALLFPSAARADEPPQIAFPRLHWGVALEGGPYFFGSGDGGVGGVTGRLGLQVTPRFSMNAQAATFVGGGITIFSDDRTTTLSTEVIATGMLGASAEIDFDYGYVALGPEAVLAATAGPTSTSGAFFGIDARVGLWAPPPRGPRDHHAGLQLGIDFHMVITPVGVMLVPLLAVGYEAF